MSIELLARTALPTDVGIFELRVFGDSDTGKEHVCLSCGDISGENVLIRIHSSCLTGECFLSLKCDCGPQLHKAMALIQAEGRGLIVYLFQEGRGIGLVNKIKAYALQEQGLDTVQANEKLGFEADERDYTIVGGLLGVLGVYSCRLLTNNPAKVQALTEMGIQIKERVPLEIPANHINTGYYVTKQEKMEHIFTQDLDLDAYYMGLAIQESKRCKNTLPNPRVGAVIVKHNEIIGRGYTQPYGGNHAEIQALQEAGEQAIGAILYVTLEPCCHYGKTPPCTQAIVNAGISKVVCAVGIDPNTQVHGAGIALLKRSGIGVITGIMQAQAEEINEDIHLYYEKRRPFVLAKFALTLDGKIATHTGESKRITCELSRKITRDLRKNYQAILVGKNTVLSDDPHLGIRQVGYTDPLRIVLDSTLTTSLTSQVYRDTHVLVATTQAAGEERIQEFHDAGVTVIVCTGSRVDLPELMEKLYALHITGILVEGGAEVLGSFFDEQLVDKVYITQAPTLMGGIGSQSAIGGIGVSSISDLIHLTNIERTYIQDDMHISGYPIYSGI